LRSKGNPVGHATDVKHNGPLGGCTETKSSLCEWMKGASTEAIGYSAGTINAKELKITIT